MIRRHRLGLFTVALGGLLVASRASAVPIHYITHLTGPNESPVNASPGVGDAQVDYDPTAHTLHVHVTFSGLTGTTTASHIHAPTPTPLSGTAGVATTTPTFANFPLGVTAGTYDNTLDMTQASSYNPAYVSANGNTTTTAEAALAAAMASGQSYLNIHSSTFGGGEIRGFLVLPEPGSAMLAATGGLFLLRRRRGA